MHRELEISRIHQEGFVFARNLAEAEEKAGYFRDASNEYYFKDAALTLDWILKNWKGPDTSWSALEGMTVLDLASGSGHSIIGSLPPWYPHFSRLCAINRAKVTAIDLNPQKGIDEVLFTSVKADLVEAVLGEGGLQSISALRRNKFDLIHTSNFVGVNRPRELENQLYSRGVEGVDFDRAFIQQAGSLLAGNGVMFLDDRDEKGHRILYAKRGADIVRQPITYRKGIA